MKSGFTKTTAGVPLTASDVLKWLGSATVALWLLSACGGGGGGGDGGGSNLGDSPNVAHCTALRAADNTTINVLALYTNAVAERYGGDPKTRISHLFNVANQVLTNSGLSSRISLVGTMRIADHDDTIAARTALEDATNGVDEFSDVAGCRNALSADMVVLYRGLVGGICGLGWVNDGRAGRSDLTNVAQHSQYMVSLAVPFTCQDFTTIHEMGHNWGLTHDYVDDTATGFFQGAQPWARGHGSTGVFNTVMAYSSSFSSPKNSYTFSNPNLTCFSVACGIPIGNLNEADAVNHLSIVIPHVIPYR